MKVYALKGFACPRCGQTQICTLTPSDMGPGTSAKSPVHAYCYPGPPGSCYWACDSTEPKALEASLRGMALLIDPVLANRPDQLHRVVASMVQHQLKLVSTPQQED
jgi:hypothetical protein